MTDLDIRIIPFIIAAFAAAIGAGYGAAHLLFLLPLPASIIGVLIALLLMLLAPAAAWWAVMAAGEALTSWLDDESR